MSERRLSLRVPYGAWVEDETEGGLTFFLSQNLSLGGILLRSASAPPAVGHKVRLRLVVENESRIMSVQGEVLRHTSEDGEFAVRFVNLDGPRMTFLRELVQEAKEAGGPDASSPDAGV
ncbi:MAG: PilZ domain-containing protein [Deltaproteobacteria bacterium]|nr:PilZ domain-containing protein [Deltaproteobacteria bacterium]